MEKVRGDGDLRVRPSLYGYLEGLRSREQREREVLAYVLSRGASTRAQLARSLCWKPEVVNEVVRMLEASGDLIARGMPHNPLFDIVHRPGTGPGGPRRYAGGPVIPPVYHFNLLCDTPRVRAFRKAIEAHVHDGTRVVELGGGSGILSILAARAGGIVTYVELDPDVAVIAETLIKDLGLDDRIDIHVGDALEFVCEPAADVVICEMMDTAMIDESQIRVMNHASAAILRPDGVAIPRAATTFAGLAEVDFDVDGIECPLPHFDTPTTNRVRHRASDRTAFHEARFGERNDPVVQADVRLVANRSGSANAVIISTDLELSRDVVLRGSAWLDPDLVLPVARREISEGEEFTIVIAYTMGTSFATLHYELEGRR